MKLKLIFVLPLLLLVNLVYAQENQVLKSQKEKNSYAIGVSMGTSLKRQALDIDSNMLSQGIKDALSDGKLLLNDKEIRDTLTNLQKEQMAKQAEHNQKLGETNKKSGEAFLAENKKKEGVVTLPSGLQYKIIKAGTGIIPKATDTVTVNYKGTLVDGTEFDSSYKRGEPATFPVGGVIPGWIEALQKMKVGSKWQLFVPANLAYGDKGAGNVIGPNAVLIFEVELISISPKNTSAPSKK